MAGSTPPRQPRLGQNSADPEDVGPEGAVDARETESLPPQETEEAAPVSVPGDDEPTASGSRFAAWQRRRRRGSTAAPDMDRDADRGPAPEETARFDDSAGFDDVAPVEIGKFYLTQNPTK